jgi:hypothetical protein
MLSIDDEKKEVRVIEKGACRGISMHFEWGLLLNLFLIHVVGQVYKWTLEALVGCPWVTNNERNGDRSGKSIEIYICNPYLHKNLSFLCGSKQTWYTSVILWSRHGDQDVFKIRVYQIRNLMPLCIVAFVGEGLVAHMDWKNIKGFNLKLHFSRF